MSRNRFLVWAAFLFAAALFLGRLGALPLIEPDEGRNAEVAREMKGSGAWLIPTYDGMPYLDKPAAYFKAVALSLALFGENETAARLPSALAALVLLLLLYCFCRRSCGERPAALSVIVVASTPLYIAFARTVIFDMPLALFSSMAVLSVFSAEEREGRARRLWHLAGAASAGIATLIKGPVGFLVPGLVVVIFHLLDRRRGFLRRYFAPLNILVFFTLTLPWFLGVAVRQPDFVNYGLIEETFRRYSTTAFHRSAPFYYYAPVLLGVFFPWSALLPEGIAAAWRRRRDWTRADRLFLIWAVVVVLFFSTSQSKLPGYILTGVVALGVLTARLFALALKDRGGWAARLVRRGAVILAATCTGAAGFLALNVLQPGRLQRIFHIHSAEFDRLQPAFLPLAATLGVIALAAAGAAWSRRPGWIFVAFLLLPVSLLTAGFTGLREYAEASSSRRLAARLSPLSEGTEVACLNCFPTGLPFYLRRPILLVTRDGHELTSNYQLYKIRRGDEWPPMLVSAEALDPWLAERRSPVFLLAGKGGKVDLERMAAGKGVAVRELVPGRWGVLCPLGEGR